MTVVAVEQLQCPTGAMSRTASRWTSRVFLAWLLFGAGGAQGAASEATREAERGAFVLGANYGNAMRIYVRYPRLAGEAREYFNDAMRDAAGGAKVLGVQLDATPPYVDPSRSDAAGAIARAMSDRARGIAVAIDARWGSRLAAVFELGYRAMFSTEFVPNLPPALQAEEVAVLRKAARQAGVPASVVEKYVSALTAGDQKAAVYASMTFKREVLAQFEAATPMTPEEARRLLNTWLAGEKVSFAVLGRLYGADAAAVDRLFKEARGRAAVFNVQLPSLPDVYSKKPSDMARALHYLMNEVGGQVSDDIRSRLGERYAAMFELAVKSSIALVMYGPETGEGDLTPALVSAIERTATTARLPPDTWRPLLQKMNARRPYPEIKAEIQRAQQHTEDHLRALAGG